VVSRRDRLRSRGGAEEADAIKRCFAAGVDACLLKDTSLVDLRQALKAVLVGRRVIDPRIAQTLATERVRALPGRPSLQAVVRAMEQGLVHGRASRRSSSKPAACASSRR
jgi:DNA-binding NarL/FixJ family response regulator